MKQEDRDMLIRINERTHNIWRIVEQIEIGQREQNGSIRTLFTNTNDNKVRTSANTIWRRVIVSVGSPVLLLIIAWLLKLNGIWIT